MLKKIFKIQDTIDVYISESNNNQKIFSSTGTSQATAIISGYVSLILSYAKKNECNIDYNYILEKIHKISNGKSTYLNELINIK